MASEEKKADDISLPEQIKQEAPASDAGPSKSALKKAAKEKEKVSFLKFYTSSGSKHFITRPALTHSLG